MARKKAVSPKTTAKKATKKAVKRTRPREVWEHEVVRTLLNAGSPEGNDAELVALLNEKGKQGWHAVSVDRKDCRSGSGGMRLMEATAIVFKRRKG